jgi:cytosine deaminase
VAAIPNPLINITLQGRHDTYPKRRGADPGAGDAGPGHQGGLGAGLRARPWYSLGTADMLDVAFMGLHVAQMTAPEEMRRCFDMVTEVNAAIIGLRATGLRVGKRWARSSCSMRAIRSRRCGCRATRLMVMARGKVIARRERSPMQLMIRGARSRDRPAV